MEKIFAEVWAKLPLDEVIGVGTGSTVEAWLNYGKKNNYVIQKAVASSRRTEGLLKSIGTEVRDLQSESSLYTYIDSADEVNESGVCIKGGGGAMTLEKIVRSAAKEFICIISKQKLKRYFGDFPLALEVLPAARSYVGRQILFMGADPVYREGFQTDSGNVILDVYGLDYTDIVALESRLNNMLGVVGHGLFGIHAADKVYYEDAGKIKMIKKC